MRTADEVARAAAHIKDALRGARIAGDNESLVRIAGMLMVLRWIEGDESTGGFAGLLRELEEADRARTAAKSN